MKLIDSFLYHNEELLLAVRLDYLDSVVDEFWICESTVDFAGRSRSPRLHEILAKYPGLNHKVKILLHTPDFRSSRFIIRKWLGRNIGWLLQDSQRDFLGKSIFREFRKSGAMVLFGDLDEIPSREAIKIAIADRRQLAMQQTLYYGSLLNRAVAPWRGTVFSEHIGRDSFSRVRGRREALPFLFGGGWHFSYFGTGPQLIEKIAAIAVSETLDVNSLPSEELVQTNLSKGFDPYGRSSGIQRLAAPDVPNDLLSLLKKYLGTEILLR